MAHTAPDFNPAEWDEVQKDVHGLGGLKSDNYICNSFAFKYPDLFEHTESMGWIAALQQ